VQGAWKTVRWPPFDWLAGAADVFHFPNFIIPPLRRGRAVVSIHDLSFLRNPEHAEERNQRFLAKFIRETARRADAIITISRFTAGEIEDLLGVERSRIHPTLLGADLPPALARSEAQAAVRARYGLDRPFVLFVSTLEPRKNIPLLLDAFERLDRPVDLVLAGMPGWKCEPILARLDASPLRARIRRLGYVPHDDLPALYAAAELFAFPSFYEGFGLPPVEAMACGTPVVASNGGSLPEVLGDGAEIVPLGDVDAWVTALRRVLDEPGLRAQLAERGRRQAARYSWAETARLTWEVYRKVGGA
jgi:glycosyltransferase involved in cell wall biosynthesis